VQWPILSVLLEIAKGERIPYVRLPRNCGPGIAWYKRLYKKAVAARIRKAGMCRTDYFGSITDYLWLKDASQHAGSMEVMVHPRYVDSGVLCDYPNRSPLVQEVGSVDRYQAAVAFI
jgi:hypothetical protein